MQLRRDDLPRYALPINVTAVLGMMNDNRAVVASRFGNLRDRAADGKGKRHERHRYSDSPAALAVSVIFGMYRGFISGVLSVAALIGAAAAAFVISPSLATWLQGNETLVNTLMYYTDAGSRIKDLDLSLLTVAQASQSAVAQIISGAQLPQQFQAAFINAVNTAPGATTMSTLLSQTIVNVSLSILSFLICFLGCYIVASFLIHLICYVFELPPVLRHLDALMGGVFGLARGAAAVHLLCACADHSGGRAGAAADGRLYGLAAGAAV
ncbi:MAG: CvpA family protein [Christensenellales bacterium]